MLIQRSVQVLILLVSSSPCLFFRAKLTILINIRLPGSFIVFYSFSANENILHNFVVICKTKIMHFFYRRLIFFVFSLLVFSFSALHAQDTIKSPPKKPKHNDILSRMDFGGYLGLQFGSVTIINIAPLASYRITEKFYAGLGLTYMYYKDNRYVPTFSLSSYGGSIFAG